MAAVEARARTRAQARAACILQARASARSVTTTAGSTAGSFPRRKLGPGYHAAEVDEFIARIEATLSGHARPGQATTAADVQAVKFKVTRHGGYDERTMDEVLDHYAHELDKLIPSPQPHPPGTEEYGLLTSTTGRAGSRFPRDRQRCARCRRSGRRTC
jgi:DivIVA domain-containing protein